MQNKFPSWLPLSFFIYQSKLSWFNKNIIEEISFYYDGDAHDLKLKVTLYQAKPLI